MECLTVAWNRRKNINVKPALMIAYVEVFVSCTDVYDKSNVLFKKFYESFKIFKGFEACEQLLFQIKVLQERFN